jgi:hypothetical protein
MGHKGPVLRPRCTRPGRARTQILFYSTTDILNAIKINSNKAKLIQQATLKKQLHTYPALMKNTPAKKHLHLEQLFE